MDAKIIAKVQRFGFDVYMRNPDDTWLYFTDGKSIGYLEDGRLGFNLSTVHKPNKQAGTGFQIERDAGYFDAYMLRRCFVGVPHWAPLRDRDSIKKYRDMSEYLNESAFNRGYQLIDKAP